MDRAQQREAMLGTMAREKGEGAHMPDFGGTPETR